MAVDWAAFAKVIEGRKKFLLTSHVRPDCDALGSELGMAWLLESLGKEVRIVNGQATPPNLAFIDPSQKIGVIDEDVSMGDLKDIEVLIVLDTSAWAQLGPMGEVIRATNAIKLIVDHHVGEDDLGAQLFKDVTAEATGRLVFEAAEFLGVKPTLEMAEPLFAAVATDTGWFRFNSVSADTYRVAARMVDAGVEPARIYSELYERDTVGRIRLRGTVLSRVETELEGRLVHTHVSREDFKQTGALPSDTEDVINMTLSIDGAQFAVILIELPNDRFKASFRSRSALDCSSIAAEFGGGGHKAAAGAVVEGSFVDVQRKVLDLVRSRMQ